MVNDVLELAAEGLPRWGAALWGMAAFFSEKSLPLHSIGARSPVTVTPSQHWLEELGNWQYPSGQWSAFHYEVRPALGEGGEGVR